MDEKLTGQGQVAAGNLTHNQNVELATATQRQVMELYHKAQNLREKLRHGNTEMESLNFGEGNQRSKLIYEVRSKRGADRYSIQPMGGEAFEIKKVLETGEGEKAIVIQRSVGESFMRGELQRTAPYNRGVDHVAALPDDAMVATIELVMGTIMAKVAERENNTTEAVAADIANVLGIEYPPQQPPSTEAPVESAA